MKKVLVVIGALAVAFGAGYIPQYLKSSSLSAQLQQKDDQYRQRLSELEEQIRILALHSELGMLLLEVENQNFGNARERSTAWFNRLSEANSVVAGETTRRTLTALSDQRDTIIARLTEANSEVVPQIRQMYRSLAAVAGIQ